MDRPPRDTVEGVLWDMRHAMEHPPRDISLHEWMDGLMMRLVRVMKEEKYSYITDRESHQDIAEILRIYEAAVLPPE